MGAIKRSKIIIDKSSKIDDALMDDINIIKNDII